MCIVYLLLSHYSVRHVHLWFVGSVGVVNASFATCTAVGVDNLAGNTADVSASADELCPRSSTVSSSLASLESLSLSSHASGKSWYMMWLTSLFRAIFVYTKPSLLTRSGVSRLRSLVCMNPWMLQLRSLDADDVGMDNSNLANSCTKAYLFDGNDHQFKGLYRSLSSRSFPFHLPFSKIYSCSYLWNSIS